jgi:hypothetical protein
MSLEKKRFGSQDTIPTCTLVPTTYLALELTPNNYIFPKGLLKVIFTTKIAQYILLPAWFYVFALDDEVEYGRSLLVSRNAKVISIVRWFFPLNP